MLKIKDLTQDLELGCPAKNGVSGGHSPRTRTPAYAATQSTETLEAQPFNLTCVNPGTPEEDCWNLIVFP